MSRRPRVAIVGSRGYPSFYGGFETAVRQIVPWLSSSNWDVLVYGRQKANANDHHDPHVRVVTTFGLETQSLSTPSFGLTSVLRAAMFDRPDVALVMNVANGYWLPILKLSGIPTAVNVDGMEWERAKWGKFARTVFKVGAWMTSKFADVIIADSREIGARWESEFNRRSVFIPYGGTPVERSAGPGKPEHSYILAVARLVPENSIHEFLDAAAVLSLEHNVKLVGSSGYGGIYEDRARALAVSHRGFEWLGHISDDNHLHQLWSDADVYFHGHTVGGTNPALVQAMACGIAIVARDTVYNREVLADAGMFVGPDSASIVDAVNTLMRDGKQRDVLAQRAVRRAQTDYSWERVCSEYERVMRRLLRRRVLFGKKRRSW